MCNRYRMTAKQAELAARYGIEPIYPEDATFPPPELFPDRRAWVVRQGDDGRRLDTMAWGFPRKVPGKKIDKATGKPVLLDTKVTNVRNYTSPFWKSALANPERRCLVPFTSFSEYGPGSTGKRPLFWFDVPSRPIVSFAGVWRPTDTGAVFAFLTTEPNPLVAPIHPKAMPVLLDEEDEERWLTCSFDEAVAHARPFPSQLMSVQQAPDPRAVIGEEGGDGIGQSDSDQPSLDLEQWLRICKPPRVATSRCGRRPVGEIAFRSGRAGSGLPRARPTSRWTASTSWW